MLSGTLKDGGPCNILDDFWKLNFGNKLYPFRKSTGEGLVSFQILIMAPPSAIMWMTVALFLYLVDGL